MYSGDVKRRGRAPESKGMERVRPARPTLLQPLSLPLPPFSLSPPPPLSRPLALYANMQEEARAPHRHPSFPPPSSQLRFQQTCLLPRKDRRNIRLLRASIHPINTPPSELTRSLSLHRSYAARMSFYRLKQFQCEVTGKSGLDYFQALESEQLEARTMHSRFPEQLKPAVLKAVQWRK